MVDFPNWDYWMYDWHPNGRYTDVQDRLGNNSESDLRTSQYNLDVEKWCGDKHRKFFWTPQEAALILFFRDPDQVQRHPEDFLFHDEVNYFDDEDGKKSTELRQWITDLYEMILNAQQTNELPQKDKLLRELYVEWAKLNKVDVPWTILEAFKANEIEEQRKLQLADGTADPSDPMGRPSSKSDLVPPDNDGQKTDVDDETLPLDGKLSSHEQKFGAGKVDHADTDRGPGITDKVPPERDLIPRERNSLLMIIFALLLEAEIYDADEASVINTILKALEHEFKKPAYIRDVVYPKDDTVQKVIRQTRARVKNFLVKPN